MLRLPYMSLATVILHLFAIVASGGIVGHMNISYLDSRRAAGISILTNELSNISFSFANFAKKVNEFPDKNGTLSEATEIRDEFLKLISSITESTRDVQATSGPISNSDAMYILGIAQIFHLTIHDVLVTVIEKKPAVQSLPLPNSIAFVEEGIYMFNNSACSFNEALITIFPEDTKLNITTMKDNIIGEFNNAARAYYEGAPA